MQQNKLETAAVCQTEPTVPDMPGRVCCFTGHRSLPKERIPSLVLQLEKLLITLIEQEGFAVFRAGGALGFDTLAAETVLHLKTRYPHIQLHLFLPCKSQAERWTEEQVRMYEAILHCADYIQYATIDYLPGCMQLRNRQLVTGSELCVACCNMARRRSGSSATVHYCQKVGVPVYNLFDCPPELNCVP